MVKFVFVEMNWYNEENRYFTKNLAMGMTLQRSDHESVTVVLYVVG